MGAHQDIPESAGILIEEWSGDAASRPTAARTGRFAGRCVSATELMEDFYRRILNRQIIQPRAEALRAAQLAIKKEKVSGSKILECIYLSRRSLMTHSTE
jgi:hypothetical protein